jgi:hypothetical protein
MLAMCFVQAKLNRKLGGKQLRKIGFLMSSASLASSAIFAANRHDFSPIRIENSHANALWFLGFLNPDRRQSDTLECSPPPHNYCGGD